MCNLQLSIALSVLLLLHAAAVATPPPVLVNRKSDRWLACLDLTRPENKGYVDDLKLAATGCMSTFSHTHTSSSSVNIEEETKEKQSHQHCSCNNTHKKTTNQQQACMPA